MAEGVAGDFSDDAEDDEEGDDSENGDAPAGAIFDEGLDITSTGLSGGGGERDDEEGAGCHADKGAQDEWDGADSGTDNQEVHEGEGGLGRQAEESDHAGRAEECFSNEGVADSAGSWACEQPFFDLMTGDPAGDDHSEQRASGKTEAGSDHAEGGSKDPSAENGLGGGGEEAGAAGESKDEGVEKDAGGGSGLEPLGDRA